MFFDNGSLPDAIKILCCAVAEGHSLWRDSTYLDFVTWDAIFTIECC
jgi:hypothetical protein